MLQFINSMTAKDYFQDILSQSGSSSKTVGQARKPSGMMSNNESAEDRDLKAEFDESPRVNPNRNSNTRPMPMRKMQANFDTDEEGGESGQSDVPAPGGERSIRNITVSPRRIARPNPGGMRSPSGINPPGQGISMAHRGDRPRRFWVWAAAIVSVIALLLLGLFAFRSTKVTITPSSRQIVFEQTAIFTAFPQVSASEGALAYNVISNDIEDSAIVPTSGTENVSEKATGNIVVYNEYSNSPVRLLKNTRFATPDGLIFRAPASITVPGKKGSTPGSVTVTVFADEPGANYNVGPISKFTLPGLKSSGDMYEKVYARSSTAFSGGFVGSRPAVAVGARESARAEIRSRIESKARESAKALSTDSSIVFPDLLQITYSTLPETTEAGGGVRIRERARVDIPVFPESLFAGAAYHMADPDADNASVSIVGTDDLSAKYVTSSAPALGTSAIEFSLSGTGTLVWDVDSSALAAALAGREQADFQDVIKDFTGVEEARATIQPFWKNSFPENAGKIRIVLKPVSAAQ